MRADLRCTTELLTLWGPACAENLRAAVAVLPMLLSSWSDSAARGDGFNLLRGDRLDQLLIATLIGCVGTAMVRSGSLRTSPLVPLACGRLINLRQAFPVTIGANLGSTITELLLTLAVSGPKSQAGMQTALTHSRFNVAGTWVHPWDPAGNGGLSVARRFAGLATGKRLLPLRTWWCSSTVCRQSRRCLPRHIGTAFRPAAGPEPLRGGDMRRSALSWSLGA
ncbi:MAG: hypothetical protein OXN89_12885 [Bryobacterales bacterium]|nr:hypothetical protein [Bryobacterales bacterium]